jgi:DNA replication factor GINS
VGLLNELEEIKRNEKEKKKELQKLRKNFYADMIKKIEDLRMEARIYVEKMDIEKASKIMDDIKKIENSLDELISLRMRKILIFTVWKSEREVKNLTKEEELFYHEVREAIERLRSNIYRRDEGSALEKKLVEEKKKEEGAVEEYVLVRVKIPYMKIALPEKDLVLKKEDVLHLPKKIYKILLKKDAVEEITTT